MHRSPIERGGQPTRRAPRPRSRSASLRQRPRPRSRCRLPTAVTCR